MTLILRDKVAFVHIPKTGGMWVRKVLQQTPLITANLKSKNSSESLEGRGSQHCVPLTDSRFINCKAGFCFVRNPLEWYKSYYIFKHTTSRWNWDKVLDRECFAEDFQKFIDNTLGNFPQGYLSLAYGYYSSFCTHTGRVEYLQEDLTKFLKELLGYDLPQRLRDHSRVNVTNRKKYDGDVSYREDQIEEIRKREKVIWDLYEES